jgi:Flp pilus assembly pilin Flp
MVQLWKDFLRDETGQDLVEHCLLLGFVALGSTALMINAGTSVKGVWSVSNTTLTTANLSAAS